MDDYSEIIIYQTEDGLTKIDVTMQDETVWLSLIQLSRNTWQLVLMTFSGDQPTLREAKNAKNYLDEKELRAMAGYG